MAQNLSGDSSSTVLTMLRPPGSQTVQFEELKKCPNCSSKQMDFLLKAPDRITGLPGEFSLMRCGNCGLVFQNPRVKESHIRFFYTNKIGYCRPPEGTKTNKTILAKVKDFFLMQALVSHFGYDIQKRNPLYFLLTLPLKSILPIKGFPVFKRHGQLLEVGCSSGEFLEKLRNLGWQVKGVEMGKDTACYARKVRHLDVDNKRIEECQFLAAEFDAIIMRMVLEHLYQPFEMLRKLTFWLKKDGQLIFSIPYFQGFEFRWFRDYSYGLQLPNHITFFNKKVLLDYLKKLGYKKIRFYYDFFDRDIIASAQYKYKDTKSWFYKMLGYNKAVRLLFIKPFVFLLSLLNKTSRLTVYVEK